MSGIRINRGRRWLPALIGVGALAWALTGCTGGSATQPAKRSTSTSSSPGPGGSSSDAAALAQRYLNAVPPTVLASARGTINHRHYDIGGSPSSPATVDVLAVQAGTNSTMVRLRLSTDKKIDNIQAQSLQGKTYLTVPDISGVTLTAAQADLVLHPGHWRDPNDPASGDCTCGWVPNSLGPAGVEFSLLYPALPSTVTEVALKVPDFASVTVPVTRS